VSWWKRGDPNGVVHFPGKMEVDYVYTPGLHGLEAAEIFKKGKVPAMLCGEQLFMPPKTFCPDDEMSRGEVIEVEGPFIAALVTVIYKDVYGDDLEEPDIIAFITVPGAAGGYIGRIKALPEEVYPGMEVRPVFKPEEERTGAITDILYWEPAEG